MSGARTVVIGTSHWHVPLYAAAMREHHDVVAVTDADPAAAVAGSRMFGAPALTEDAILDLPDIELAYVFGRHDSMGARCLELIRRGVPFVVEKPLGTDLGTLEEVRDAAAAAGVPATVPLVQRGGPVDAWLRRAGRPVYSRTSFIAGPPERYRVNGNPWMLDPVAAGGGCLANLGPHFVDLFLAHVGEGASLVSSSLRSTMHGEAVEDHASLVVATGSGREALIEVGYAFPDAPSKRYCSFTVAGEEGFASIDERGQAELVRKDGRREERRIDVDSDPLYAPFVRDVARTVARDFDGLPTLDDLHAAMSIVWAAYRAAGTTTTEGASDR
ncbi:hypothetical protein GCM10025864_03130 [Luteimicrobium album]|uniref:Oxidoreductase n=1 Tax=Luteimicrobium album TaxID=1054550 RepID=A0ABQ6HVL7_9MICO|nr:Gfo/Idh/MocA family oxidoreductase [Luteimicrobium album]GMA22554.1 hypothetical protein GCM10025864_03130 [Luteimicrobium album]